MSGECKNFDLFMVFRIANTHLHLNIVLCLIFELSTCLFIGTRDRMPHEKPKENTAVYTVYFMRINSIQCISCCYGSKAYASAHESRRIENDFHIN